MDSSLGKELRTVRGEFSNAASGGGRAEASLHCRRCCGRTAFAGSQPVQKSARGRSSPASAPRGVCRSVQPMRSAIKCSKASRSSHTAVRRAPARAAAATGEGKGEVGRQHQSEGTCLQPGGRSCFQSVMLQDAWGTPVYVSGRAMPQLLGGGQFGSLGLPCLRDAGRRVVRQGCQAPWSGSANSHANNLQPVTKHTGVTALRPC